jgi:hypothetical protein
MLRDGALVYRVINLWVSQDEGEILYKLSLFQLLKGYHTLLLAVITLSFACNALLNVISMEVMRSERKLCAGKTA